MFQCLQFTIINTLPPYLFLIDLFSSNLSKIFKYPYFNISLFQTIFQVIFGAYVQHQDTGAVLVLHTPIITYFNISLFQTIFQVHMCNTKDTTMFTDHLNIVMFEKYFCIKHGIIKMWFCAQKNSSYHIAQNIGGVKLWRNRIIRAFGRENFGEFSKCSITF